MKILRTFIKLLALSLFSIFLGLSILMLVLVEFTQYENIKPIAVDLINKTLFEKEMEKARLVQIRNQMLEFCSNQKTENISFSLDWENITLRCSDIKESKPEDLGSLFASAIFDKLYFKEYACKFIQCLKEAEGMEKIAIFVSAKSSNFFKKILNYLFLGIIASGIVFTLSSKELTSALKNMGITCIIIGLPFFFMSVIKNMIKMRLREEAIGILADKILNSISAKLLFIFIAGVSLTAFALIFRYLTKKRT